MGGKRLRWVIGAACVAAAGATGSCVGDEPTTPATSTDAGAGADAPSLPGNDAQPPEDAGDAASDGGCASGDTSCDPKNCGATGHDCFRGTCNAGKCLPVVIAMGQAKPMAILGDGIGAYWVNWGTSCGAPDGQVVRATDDGTTLTLTVMADLQRCPDALFEVGADLYWVERGTNDNATVDGTIWKSPKTGTPTKTAVYAALGRPTQATTDGTNLFWAQGLVGDPTSIMRGTLAGTADASAIVTGEAFVDAITTDGTSVYWSMNAANAVHAVALDGGADAAELAGSEDTPHALTLQSDGGALYWVDEGSGLVRRMTLPSQALASIATAQNSPLDMGIDDTYAYWVANTTANGFVMRTRLDGTGMPEIVISTTNPGLHGIAVTDKAIFTTNFQTGNVLRVAKP